MILDAPDRSSSSSLEPIDKAPDCSYTTPHTHENIVLGLKGPEFKAFLTTPLGEFAVALLPDRVCREFPGYLLLVLTERIAAKMAAKHPDVTARQYLKLHYLLTKGEMLSEWHGDKRARVFVWKTGKHIWRLVIWFSERKNVAQIVTFHKISQRAYRKHAAALLPKEYS